MGYFPFFMDLTGADGLIVGGGRVALRKVEKLLPYGPRLRVVAEQILPELRTMDGVTLFRRTFSPDDLRPETAFVIAATDDLSLNRRIAVLCRERRIPVNVVDDPDACSFFFPALVQRGPLSVGVSTGGASPTAAGYFRQQIETVLPDATEDILNWLASVRSDIRLAEPEERRRAALYRALFLRCLELGRPLTADELEELI